MTGPWRWHAWTAAVAGRAHREGRKRCQDYCRCRLVQPRGVPIAIAVVADGAGSAEFGRIGARTAGDALLNSAERFVADHSGAADVGRDQILEMFEQARGAISRHARRRPMRRYATTIALAMLGPDSSAFAQIGDSVIVAGCGGEYAPVFWPENGEFVNTTSFLTESRFEEHLRFELRATPITEVALFTDGLSPIALNLCEQKAHRPFFYPLFAQLRDAIRSSTPRRVIERQLRQFLGSESMESRVDDDRSLVLICGHGQDKNDGDLLG